MQRVEESLRSSILIEFLGAENVEELKKRVVDVIVEQINTDLRDSYDYIIPLDSITDSIADEVVENVKRAIQPKLEKAVYENTMAKLGLSLEV